MSNPIDEALASSPVQRVAAGCPIQTRSDWVAVEAPLEVHIGAKPLTVLMRTPGDDEELVRGFLFNEGIIASLDDIIEIDRSPSTLQDNIINVQLRAGLHGSTLERNFFSSSSCGVCGKNTIAALEVKGALSDSQLNVARKVLSSLPDRLRAAQMTFAKTGGVHASGLFTSEGELVALREDVGRHNALDKLIGWALVERKIPLVDYLLLVSGRVSFELVQKAVAASIPLIAAVGAPSSLAVELAERFNITLVGFLRSESMNIYSSPERVID
jgi:FdhD protein